MVLTVNNFTGFETQGAEESSALTGTPTYDPVSIPTGGSALLCISSQAFSLPWVVGGVSDAGVKYIFGFKFNKLGENSSSVPSIRVLDDSAGVILAIDKETDGTFTLQNAVAIEISTTVVLAADENHYFEVYADLNSASGDWEWFVDGVSIDSGSSADFTDGNAFGGSASSLQMFGDAGSGSPAGHIFDDVYILSGATAASDRLGPVEVYMKQGAVGASATPDSSNSVLSDTDLDEGTWDLASETPLNEQSQTAAPSYTGSGSTNDGVSFADGSGDKLGPNSDDRFLGVTIKAMKGIWRMARSGGGTTAQFGIIGNDANGGTLVSSDLEVSADLDIGTGYANFEFLTETAATLPSLTEHAAVGFRKDGGGQDMDVAEMWCMILTVPAAPAITALSDSDLEYPDQNYFVGPFEI